MLQVQIKIIGLVLISKSSSNLIKVVCEAATKKEKKIIIMETTIKQKMEQP